MSVKVSVVLSVAQVFKQSNHYNFAPMSHCAVKPPNQWKHIDVNNMEKFLKLFNGHVEICVIWKEDIFISLWHHIYSFYARIFDFSAGTAR